MPLPEIGLAETNFGRVLKAVQDTIKETKLPGMPNDNVVISKLGWVNPEIDTFPRTIIEPRTEIANPNDGTNERDDTIYNVMICMLVAGGLDTSERNIGLPLFWRQTVWRLFRNKTPNTFTNLTVQTGSSFNRVTVEPGDVWIEQAKRQQLDGQYLLARFSIREPRT